MLARLQGFGRARRGTATVEFALVMPMLLVVYLGGIAASQAVSTWRKVCDTTSQVTNVIDQFTSAQASDVQGVMTAAAQIMYPFSTSSLKEVITEVSVNSSGSATVTWSQAYNGGVALAKGAAVTLPSSLAQPNATVMWVQASYAYTPVAGITFFPTVTMNQQLYGIPRSSSSIPCSNC